MRLLILPVLFFTVSSAFAQVTGGVHTKLMDLYVMGDFEKCAQKAESLTESDKTKNESEPYLYMAMCMKKISEDPELSQLEEYKKATKDMMKLAGKFKKKDDKLKSKGKDYLYDQNIETVYEFIQVGAEAGFQYYVQNDFNKAKYFYDLAYKLDPSENSVKIMYGLASINYGIKEGQAMIDEAMENFKVAAAGGGYSSRTETAQTFEHAFIYYTDFLMANNRTSDAEKVIQLARELDAENERFKKKYQEVYGS